MSIHNRHSEQATRGVIHNLVDLGERIAKGESSPNIQQLKTSGHINTLGVQSWKTLTAQLSVTQLFSLLKGITWAEAEFQWIGGSVAGASHVFKTFLEKTDGRALLDEVSAWVISHRRNPYIPFGTQKHGRARNYSDFLKIDAAYQAEKAVTYAEATRRQEQASKNRAHIARCKARAEEDRANGAREQLIASLVGLSIQQKLQRIIDDQDHLPNYYPTSIAGGASDEVLASLPSEMIEALAEKLIGKYRGPWAICKKRLLKVIQNQET